jgi:hypothetical protein
MAYRRRSLAEGMLVEASVEARVLRLRLLTLDASVLLLPTGPTATTSVQPGAATRGSELNGSALDGLPEATRRIDEGARLLARARRNRPVPRRMRAWNSEHPAD